MQTGSCLTHSILNLQTHRLLQPLLNLPRPLLLLLPSGLQRRRRRQKGIDREEGVNGPKFASMNTTRRSHEMIVVHSAGVYQQAAAVNSSFSAVSE